MNKFNYNDDFKNHYTHEAKKCFVTKIESIRKSIGGGTPLEYHLNGMVYHRLIDQYIEALESTQDCIKSNKLIIEQLIKYCDDC